MKKTIILFSGGLDSATVLAACKADGDECLAIGFDYGQAHKIELDRAEQIARHYETQFEIVDIPHMPKINDVVFAGRNMIFASVAIGIAQAQKYDRIAVGCNASDWLRFPDCRPDFWASLKRCAEAYDITVITPLLHATKREVVEAARKLNVPIDLTWSCYEPQSDQPCGKCLACKTRQEAMR